MCTATWMRTDDGYHVFFNRDERPARRPAEPPALRRTGATRFVAPLDGDFGGTWLAANEFGVTVFVHNGYAPADDAAAEPEGGYRSRGLIVTSLIRARSAGQALRALDRLGPENFRTFLLVVFEPDGRTTAVRWDGDVLRPADEELAGRLLVSSSYRRDDVHAAREALYREMTGAAGGVEAHLAFHRSHRPERGPFSPCMHRPDAGTVSFAWVRVAADDVAVRYAPGPPCETPLGDDDVRLPRRRRSG